jgi:hypothetical protein
MCSVGSGMVLAIGDLAGATVVTLLATRQHSSPVRVAYGRSKFAARLGWSGMALAIDDPPWRRSCRS